MKPLDNYLVTLALTAHKLGVPLRDDGWPIASIKGSGVAFHLGRFIYHAAHLRADATPIKETP